MNTNIFLTLLFLIFSLSIYSQSYSVTVDSAEYVDLVGSTSLNEGEVWDDPQFEIPFGFDFKYLDTIVNNLFISDEGTGGILSFGDLNLGKHPVLIMNGADLIDRGFVNSVSESNISYLVEGEEGSKILKVEWNNVGFYSELYYDNVSSDFANFQAWFYEGSNDIEIRIGGFTIDNPSLSLGESPGFIIGLWDDVDYINDSFGALQVLVGDPNSPTISIITDFYDYDYDDIAMDDLSPEGIIYRFSQETSSTQLKLIDRAISLYPNPSMDNINILFDENDINISSYTILNSLGQLMKNGKFTDSQIDVSYLIPGFYFVELETDQGVIVKQISKL